MWANLVSANFVTAVSLLTGSFVSFLSPVLDAESPVLSVLTLVWDHQSVQRRLFQQAHAFLGNCQQYLDEATRL